MRKMRVVWFAMVLLTVSLVNFSAILTNFGPEVANAGCNNDCRAKDCDIGGKDCTCCLIAPGSITCSPCGAWEC